MKNTSLLPLAFVFLVFSFRLQAQNVFAGSFETLYNYDIANTHDSGFIVCGTNSRGRLNKFDKNSNLVWSVSIENGINTFQKIIETGDKGFVGLGDHIVWLDSMGNFIRSRGYTLGGGAGYSDLLIADIKLLPDQSLIIAAQNHYHPTLFKTNAAGDVLWSTTIPRSNYETLYCNSIVIGKDGNIFMGGDTESKNQETGEEYYIHSPFLMKFDSTGTMLWKRRYTFQNEADLCGLVQSTDGNLVLAGTNSPSGLASSSDMFFAKADTAGNIIWANQFGSNIYVEFPAELINTKDGAYHIIGTKYITYANHEVFNLKFNDEGNILWRSARALRPGYLGFRPSVVQTYDSGYINTIQQEIYTVNKEGMNCSAIDFPGELQSISPSIVYTAGTVIPNIPVVVSTYTEVIHSITDNISITCVEIVLPLKFLSFIAKKEIQKISLEWKTANEINTNYFSIERSNNGLNYMQLGTIKSKDNGSQIRQYSFQDANPKTGINYYRLKQVDDNGKFSYSSVVTVDFSKALSIKIEPDPVYNILTIKGLGAGKNLTIIDASGTIKSKTTSANDIYNWNIQHLSAGNYYLVIDENGKRITSLKFVKQ